MVRYAGILAAASRWRPLVIPQPSAEGAGGPHQATPPQDQTTSSHLAIKSALFVAYDSRSPLGIRTLDTGLKTTLQASF